MCRGFSERTGDQNEKREREKQPEKEQEKMNRKKDPGLSTWEVGGSAGRISLRLLKMPRLDLDALLMIWDSLQCLQSPIGLFSSWISHFKWLSPYKSTETTRRYEVTKSHSSNADPDLGTHKPTLRFGYCTHIALILIGKSESCMVTYYIICKVELKWVIFDQGQSSFCPNSQGQTKKSSQCKRVRMKAQGKWTVH